MDKPTPKIVGAHRSAQPAPRAAIRIPKTAELVAASIRKMIIRGEVKEGDFLQPEAQLMAHFGTSRPTIREAFRILENEQLISIVRGSRSGARVHAPSFSTVARHAGFALQAQGTLLSDIYLARLAIEPFAVRLLAEGRTEAQLDALRGQLESLQLLHERGASAGEFPLAVFKLHHSIVEAAGSNTLTMISAMIQGIIEQHMANATVRTDPAEADSLRQRRKLGLRSISKLFHLLEARDADAAEAHWRTHIRNANDVWLHGYDQTALVDVLD